MGSCERDVGSAPIQWLGDVTIIAAACWPLLLKWHGVSDTYVLQVSVRRSKTVRFLFNHPGRASGLLMPEEQRDPDRRASPGPAGACCVAQWFALPERWSREP